VWTERGLLVAGCLVLIGAVLSIVSLFPYYVSSHRTLDEARFTWNAVIGIAAAAVAATLLLAPGTRRLVGSGFLLGSGVLAVNAVIVGLTLETSGFYGESGPALWLDVAAGTVRLCAIVIVVVSVVGSGSLHLARRPAPYFWLTALAGIVGAVALYVEQRGAEWFEPEVDAASVTWTSIAAVVVPLAAAMILPHRFAIALLAGWLACGLGILAFNDTTDDTIELPVFATTLVALVIALGLLIHADYRTRTTA
jgi:hypothetical protein